MSMNRILVPIDYSDCSRVALVFAAELARELGSSLDVLHVWDEPAYLANIPEARNDTPGHRPMTELIREYAERDMEDFMSGTSLPDGVQVTRRLKPGEPASTLLEELRQKQHDLVVVGTHGRTGLSHLLLGSVAEKLARLSPIPVLTVPRPRS